MANLSAEERQLLLDELKRRGESIELPDQKSLLREELNKRQNQVEAIRPENNDASLMNLIPGNHPTSPIENRVFGDIASGLGTGLRNLLNESKREWEFVAPNISHYIPSGPSEQTTQRLGGENLADRLLKSLAENALNLATPESGIARGVVSAIPKIGPVIAGAASRIVPQALLGATTNENPLEGGATAGITQGALESIPALGKPFAAYAEAVNPIKFAGQKLEDIKSALSNAKEAESQAYAPFNQVAEKFKFKKLDFLPEAIEDYSHYLTPSIKKRIKDFENNPTLKNAHDLQSKMYQETLRLGKAKAPDEKQLDAIKAMREALNQDIEKVLPKLDKITGKDISGEYLRGRQIHREEVAPFISNHNLAELLSGEIQKVKPQELQQAIDKSVTAKRIPEGHYLRQALEDINKKMNKAKMYQYGIPAGIGGIAAHGLHAGLAPLLGGLGIGGLVGHGLGNVAELVQNPEVQLLLEKLGQTGTRFAQPLIRGAID